MLNVKHRASFSLAILMFAVCQALAQIYRPPEPYKMWDTWLFKDGGQYHLFFLQSEPGLTWNTIGHAVSKDLMHWQTLPPIPAKGPPGSWDHGPTLTGITVKQGDRYWLFYGSVGTGHQQIGAMLSRDLMTWEKYSGNPILGSRAPYYDGGSDWRDLYAHYDRTEKVWHGYICARAPGGAASIAHLTSKDLVDWQYLPPVFVSSGEEPAESQPTTNAPKGDQAPTPKGGSSPAMEVPGYFELNGRHYLVFAVGNVQNDTSGRKKSVWGNFYAMSGSRDGPYQLPDRPLLLGSGRNRVDGVIARTIPWGNTRLLYHHTVAARLGGEVTFGTPKLVRQHADGTLWLEYWPGLAKLEKRPIWNDLTKVPKNAQIGPGTWKARKGSLTGASPDETSILWLPISATDTMTTFALDAVTARSAGLVWWWDGQRGAAVTLSPAAKTVSVVQVARAGSGLPHSIVDDIDGVTLASGSQHLRIFVRGRRVEVYLNGCWLLNVGLPDLFAKGRMGLLVEGGAATFGRLRVAELEPMP